jgi:hypothetical protein
MFSFRFIVFILLVSLFLGCSKNEETIVRSGVDRLGKVSFSLSDIPSGIKSIRASITRTGFESDTIFLSISDTGNSASGKFENIIVGRWHLLIDAFDSSDILCYFGEADLDVVDGQTTMIELNMAIWPGHTILSNNMRWEWTRDARGGGAQDKVLFQNNIISVLPVDFVHFINKTVNQGEGTYSFKFKGDNLKFAWRISPQDSSLGKALILQWVYPSTFILAHMDWNNFYYRWENGSYFINQVSVSSDTTIWHSIEIQDKNNTLKIFFDGSEIDIFTGQHPATEFLADVQQGYIGIGNENMSTIQYKDFQVIVK